MTMVIDSPAIQPSSDRALINALVSGQSGAWESFVRRMADPIWSACRVVTKDDSAAQEAFTQVFDALAVNDCGRLRAYNGASPLERFVILVAREVLSERLLTTFRVGQDGWPAFERFFRSDIQRLIAKRLGRPEHQDLRRDVYQEICLALIAERYRRILAHDGTGSFTGFILQVADRLCVDAIRHAVSRAQGGEDLALPDDFDAASDTPSPERHMLDAEAARQIDAASGALRDLATEMDADEADYLRVALSDDAPLAARDIAQRLGRPVEDIYKLKQRLMIRLRERLKTHPAVKEWLASV